LLAHVPGARVVRRAGCEGDRMTRWKACVGQREGLDVPFRARIAWLRV
jgi:hypothetical protein